MNVYISFMSRLTHKRHLCPLVLLDAGCWCFGFGNGIAGARTAGVNNPLRGSAFLLTLKLVILISLALGLA